MKKKIVVFAANDCIKEKEKYYYSLAYETGKALAEAGFVTVTGGGPGLMNEICRGAFENKGETHGVCLNIEGRIHSKFLTTHEMFDLLNPRQERLLQIADGFISLPGGIGTLYEVVAVLALKRKGEIPEEKPLILIDNFYHEFHKLIKTMETEGFVFAGFDKLYDIVKSPEETIRLLNKKINQT